MTIPYHQPAISAYAPASRNTLLHHPNKKHKSYTNKKVATLTVYLLLKFWDSPVLQQVFSKLASFPFWKEKRFKNVLDSSIGKRSSKGIKISSLFLARCLIRTIGMFRLDKIRLLDVPLSIRKWVDTNNNDNANTNANTNAIANDSILECKVAGDNSENVRMLKWHGKQIDNVLKYWFGQYTPDKAQKNLWMIAASSNEQLQKVDAEITKEYASLLVEIGTKDQIRNLWCGRCEDRDSDHNNDGNENDSNENLYGWRGKVAAIILLDQMSRHIHRYQKTSARDDSQSIINDIPNQSILDSIALKISKKLQLHHSQEIISGMIPTPMLIFALMPYRHASTLQTVGFVQRKVEEIANMSSIDVENMIRRFRRATNRRMAVLQDEARRAGRNTHYIENESNENDNSNGDENVNENTVTNQRATMFGDEDILEFQPFTADMSNANQHPIVKTVINFLTARGIHPVKKNMTPSRHTPVLVSLSGGVDSMVIASALSFIRDNCGYGQLFLVSVHVDYGNRPESAAEASFVQDYALNVVTFDDCIIRRIDEVTRGETKRDEYEKVSRNVRYDLYKSTISKSIQTCTDNDPKHSIKEVGVMLGHHCGDVVENVISNSNKGCGPLDLSGMTDVSQNDGVTIYRPLLPLDKEDVYDYSHKFGVPYFKDTTPHWSTRGKLRNKLIPLLEEIYGDGCLGNLAKLAGESDQARDLFNKSAFSPFMETVVRYPMGVVFGTAPFKSQGSYFWKIVLRDVLHGVGLGMFSDKSIASFLARALSNKIRSGWLQCRKDYAVYLMNDGRVMVLYPQYFPWRKSDAFKIEKKAIQFGKEEIIGPWAIHAEIVCSSEEDDLLKMKAIGNIEDLMSGDIQYYVQALETEQGRIQPLTFVEGFTKDTRPMSWKKADLRVESTLPILGNDIKTTNILSDNTTPCKTRLAKVTLRLKTLNKNNN